MAELWFFFLSSLKNIFQVNETIDSTWRWYSVGKGLPPFPKIPAKQMPRLEDLGRLISSCGEAAASHRAQQEWGIAGPGLLGPTKTGSSFQAAIPFILGDSSHTEAQKTEGQLHFSSFFLAFCFTNDGHLVCKRENNSWINKFCLGIHSLSKH